MRKIRFIASLAAVVSLFGIITYCSDYSFEPLTEIAVLPGSLSFTLTPPAGLSIDDQFKEVQHFYVENRSLSANIRINDMWLYDKDTNEKMQPLLNGVPTGSCDGYFYTQTEAGTNQHFFQLQTDVDLRFLATDNAGIRQVVSNAANAVRIGAKCDQSADGCPLYSLKTATPQVLALFGLNYCDQLAVREYLTVMHDGEGGGSASIVPKRFATYRQLASQGSNAELPGEAATSNPWRRELKLASCESISCEYTEFFEDMVSTKHPDIYGGLDPLASGDNGLLDMTGQPDWDKLQTICRISGAGSAFKQDKLSVDILDDGTGLPSASKIQKNVQIDTVKVVLRYVREPGAYDSQGNWRDDGRSVCGLPAKQAYEEINPIQNRLEVQIGHTARQDVSTSLQEDDDIGKKFLARVGVNLKGKSSNFPVPVISDDTATDDGNCTKTAFKEPLLKVFIDGTKSYSPTGNVPLSYWWELVEKPANAIDAKLICSTCDYAYPDQGDVTYQWTSENYPKIYLPLAGTYKIRLKVRDSRLVESATADNTDSCQWAYLTLQVVSQKKVYVQLSWDRGNGVDMDLFLARYRECGTMGIPFAFQDRVLAPVATFPSSCTGAAQCNGLPCTGGSCDTSCGTDDQCKVAHPAWVCSGGYCTEKANREWACETDADCAGQGYCNPRDISQCAFDRLCTNHKSIQINDSCGCSNPYTDFGEECNPDDNADLDIDDVAGYGPEITTIREPPADTYRAVVRLFSDPQREMEVNPPSTAFVSVYLSGEFCGTYSMPFDKETVYWKVADIVWQGDGTSCSFVTPVAVNPSNAAEATANQCLDADNAACDYANPFNALVASPFDPCDDLFPRSIWCDSAGDPDCNLSSCVCD